MWGKTKSKKSMLASFLWCVGVINLLSAFAAGVLRRHEAQDALFVWKGQMFLSAAGTFCSLLLFFYFLLRLKKQGFGHGAEIPLFYIWGVILIGVQAVYDITVVLYDKFIDGLNGLLPAASYVSLYNGTHGFKYLGMFIAMILGILFTAILLKDRFLMLVGSGLSALFMLAFLVFQMWTVSIASLHVMVGIVWTSVIFHLMQTVGMIFLGWYIGVKWKWQNVPVAGEEKAGKEKKKSSLICPVTDLEKERDRALEETERFAEENGFSAKVRLHLRLLSEELLNIADVTLDIQEGFFWAEKKENICELHFMADTPIREKGEAALLKVTKDKKNAAYRGMTGVIRRAADELTGAVHTAGVFGAELISDTEGNAFWSGFHFGGEYNKWVYSELKKQAEYDKRMANWDELELSVLDRLAEDIIVSARKNRVEITVKMKIEQAAGL